MATIHRIETTTSSRSNGQTAGTKGAGGAEIILFPGVRYERWREAQEANYPSIRSRAKRDRLEIAD